MSNMPNARPYSYIISVQEKIMYMTKTPNAPRRQMHIQFGLLKELYKFPDLSTTIQTNFFDPGKTYKDYASKAKLSNNQIKNLFRMEPKNIPLWLLEYKDFWELVKDHIYIKFLPNSRASKADKKKIEAILGFKIGEKIVNIDGKIKDVKIALTETATTIDKKLKEPNPTFQLDFILFKYQGIDNFTVPAKAINGFVIEPEYKKLLKVHPDQEKAMQMIYDEFYSQREHPKVSLDYLIKVFSRFPNFRIQTSTSTELIYVKSNDIVGGLAILKDKEFIKELVNALTEDRNYFKYKNNYYVFNLEEMKKHQEQIVEMFLGKKMKEFLKHLQSFKQYKNQKNDKFLEMLEKSKNFQAKLQEHQEVGSSWIYNLYSNGAPGAILADGMGMGKSLMTIAFLSGIYEESKRYKKVVILCPASVLSVWENEIGKFNSNMKKQINKTIFIYSYEKAIRENIAETDILILDEGQKIKNKNTEMFKSAFKIKKEFALILSGTPIENKIEDLISLIHVINDTAYEFFYTLRKLYRNNKTLIIAKIREAIDPIYLQRKISNENLSAELHQINEFIDVTSKEEKLYKEIIKIYNEIISKEMAENNHDYYSANTFLIAFLRLRQAISYPGQLPPELIAHLSDKTLVNITPSKTLRLKKLYKDIKNKNEKLVVFTEFTGTLRYLKQELEKDGAKVLTLSGSDSAQKRKIMIEEFQNNSTYDVFIIMLKAGNSGITLTSANNVVIYDLWFNPQIISQAIARAYRIGQTKDVSAYLLINKKSIDERIHDILYSKRKIIDSFEGYKVDKNLIMSLGEEIFGFKKKGAKK